MAGRRSPRVRGNVCGRSQSRVSPRECGATSSGTVRVFLVGDGLAAAVAVFSVAVVVLLVLGPRTVRLADKLADATGLGEAVMGAVFLGAMTSLPDTLASVSAGLADAPELAVANGYGGIIGQTAFLAVADITYRRANLEHAAVSVPNMIQGTVLIALLSLVLVAIGGPDVAIWGVHPVSPLLVAVYVYGLRVSSQASATPMWQPRKSDDTVADVPDGEPLETGLVMAWVRFGVLASMLGVVGWALGESGLRISEESGLSQTAVGALLTGLASSLSELVVAIVAIRRGALTLAVANIIGGNTFDALIVGAADVAYREGSIYHQVTDDHLVLIGVSTLMTALVIMGLLRRERRGIANIGFESAAVLVLYAATVVVLLT